MSGISIICFAASYTVALVLEVTRLFFRSGIQQLVIWGFALAGLVAQTSYLAIQAQQAVDGGRAPLSSWYHWLLIASWALAGLYLVLAISRPRTSVGLFLLPLVLALVAVAWCFPDDQAFARAHAGRAWGITHGIALLLGTVSVFVGFASGVMYLIQSYRLKHKMPPRQGFRLPSLEWLQSVNERAFVVSSLLLAAGVLSGIILNLVKYQVPDRGIPWTDPVFGTSVVLLMWLLGASVFNVCYRPARRGRKVAYLTVTSFALLALALAAALWAPSQHASSGRTQRPARESFDIIGQSSMMMADDLVAERSS